MVEAASKRMRKNLSILFTEVKDIKPLLSMDWLGQFIWTIRLIKKSTTQTDQPEGEEIFTQIEKLFKTNKLTKDTEIGIQIKPGHLPIKQKARPKPYHLQIYVEKATNKLIKSRQLQKVQKVDEDCFVPPVVVTMKKKQIS